MWCFRTTNYLGIQGKDMKKLTTKALVTALTVAAASTFSLTAQAEQVSPEQAVTKFVMTQGKQLMNDLSVQLQSTITQELNTFSIDNAVTWLTEPQTTELTQVKQTKNSTNKSADEE